MPCSGAFAPHPPLELPREKRAAGPAAASGLADDVAGPEARPGAKLSGGFSGLAGVQPGRVAEPAVPAKQGERRAGRCGTRRPGLRELGGTPICDRSYRAGDGGLPCCLWFFCLFFRATGSAELEGPSTIGLVAPRTGGVAAGGERARSRAYNNQSATGPPRPQAEIFEASSNQERGSPTSVARRRRGQRQGGGRLGDRRAEPKRGEGPPMLELEPVRVGPLALLESGGIPCSGVTRSVR